MTVCQVGRCGKLSVFSWYDWQVCQKHWDKHSSYETRWCLHRIFGVKAPCWQCGTFKEG